MFTWCDLVEILAGITGITGLPGCLFWYHRYVVFLNPTPTQGALKQKAQSILILVLVFYKDAACVATKRSKRITFKSSNVWVIKCRRTHVSHLSSTCLYKGIICKCLPFIKSSCDRVIFENEMLLNGPALSIIKKKWKWRVMIDNDEFRQPCPS